jgi:hypothetical protein
MCKIQTIAVCKVYLLTAVLTSGLIRVGLPESCPRRGESCWLLAMECSDAFCMTGKCVA